jgi:hypothetical protein
MNRTDTAVIGVSLLIFLATPFLPTTLYKMAFTNMFVPFFVMLLVLVLVGQSPLGSVAALLAVMSLFIEYRHRVLSTSLPLPKEAAQYEDQLAPAPPIMPDEIHPAPREPAGTRVIYKPTSDATNEFEPVGSSVNSKSALPGVRLPKDTNQFLIEHGLTGKSAY